MGSENMKILLIEALIVKKDNEEDREKQDRMMYPALVLPLLAALTPPDIEVKIINDTFGIIYLPQGQIFALIGSP